MHITVITLEHQINHLTSIFKTSVCVCVGGCCDYDNLEVFETARRQTAYTLKSVNLFTLKTHL